MTVQDVITQAGHTESDGYDQEMTLAWLCGLDRRIHQEIMLPRECAPPEPEGPYTPDTELLVPAPYDDLYLLYIRAQNEFFRDQMDRGGNAFAMFNTAYERFAAWYIRTHGPARNTYISPLF